MLNKRNIFIILILIIGLILGGGYYYLNQSYQPLEGNDEYLNKMNVSEYKKYYQFKSEDNIGIIFYPGGKVDATAYAPLADMLSQKGFTTYIVKMPFNLAIFDKDRAEIILDEYEQSIDNLYIMGHSLGGAMAASYLHENNVGKFKGIIFLASYPPEKVDFSNKKLKALSINGEKDQVIDRNKVEASKNILPSGAEFNIIKGGNHAGFGNYGPQKGDGKRTISREEQWKITANLISDFIQKNK